MLLKLTDTNGKPVLVNTSHLVRARAAASTGTDLWLSSGEQILVKEDADAIEHKASGAAAGGQR